MIKLFEKRKKQQHEMSYSEGFLDACKMYGNKLPSVQQERGKSYWIVFPYYNYGWKLAISCDKCGERSDKKTNFCPNCGADKRGENA